MVFLLVLVFRLVVVFLFFVVRIHPDELAVFGDFDLSWQFNVKLYLFAGIGKKTRFAFVLIVRTRPSPIFGRPVHPRFPS
jgi:hypothetical protein